MKKIVTKTWIPGLHMLALVFALSFSGVLSQAAEEKASDAVAWMSENYTKTECLIPMRDGVKLFTRVYAPKDKSQTWPILLMRSPYSLNPYGPDAFGKPNGSELSLAKDKFILVAQDVRGRYHSEGQFVHVRPFIEGKRGPQMTDESSDAWDTIDWLVKNLPNNNGKVGLYGSSYPGFYTSMGMIEGHPALKVAVPQAPISDWYMGDDMHHNGALLLSPNLGFLAAFDGKAKESPMPKIEDAYEFFLKLGPLANADTQILKGCSAFWLSILDHPNYDIFWKARNIRPHLKNVKAAVMTVGGWFDAEDFFGTLETYKHVEAQNPGITNVLVIGPWIHSAWNRSDGQKIGDVDFGDKTVDFYQEKIQLPFLRRYLKDDKSTDAPEALVFETGRNRWRSFACWPPKQTTTRSLYLRAKGALSREAPALEEGWDEYLSDPANPVPYSGHKSPRYWKAFPVEDQSFLADRKDVLSFSTIPQAEDMTLAGPIGVELCVSTSGTDADWVVKVIDQYTVDAAGKECAENQEGARTVLQLVRADVMRGRYRNGFEKPERFTPGRITSVRFSLPDICHCFRKGHRLMVQVQNSWYPYIDRNPQTFVDIAKAKAEDYRKAMQRVYHSSAAASSISVHVLEP